MRMCRCDDRARRVREECRATEVATKMHVTDAAETTAFLPSSSPTSSSPSSSSSCSPFSSIRSARSSSHSRSQTRSRSRSPSAPDDDATPTSFSDPNVKSPNDSSPSETRFSLSSPTKSNIFVPSFSSSSCSRRWNSSTTRLICVFFVSWWITHDQQVFGLPDPPELTTIEDLSGRGTLKFGDNCVEDRECGFAGSYCEPKKGKCACREEFLATNHIDKCGQPANVNETCFFHEQCEAKVSQTECRDGRCICIFEKVPVTQSDGSIVCVAEQKETPPIRYIDPAMIGVLVGMALMFIIICVVLRLFSKARWRENRTIFNTPNARLMNVSLLRENKLLHAQERRGSRASVRVPSRQPSMASLRAHSPNASQGSRTGSRRGSRGSSGNASAASMKSNKSPPKDTNNAAEPVLENVTVEIFEPKP